MINETENKMNMKWKVLTPATTYPISVDEVKEYARIDGEEEDNLLSSLIEACTEKFEDFLGKALLSQTIELTFDVWETDVIKLPKPPLLSITSVVTIDEDDTETTYSSDNYYVRTDSIPGQLIIKKGYTKPINTERYYGGYKITYVAGYGTVPEQVPNFIRKALKSFVALIYEKRVTGDSIPPEILREISHTRNRWRFDE